MLRWRRRGCTCAHTGRQRAPSIRLLLLPAHLLHLPHPHLLELLLLAEPFCVWAYYWRTRKVSELTIGWTILWQCSVGILYWPDSYVYDVPIGWRQCRSSDSALSCAGIVKQSVGARNRVGSRVIVPTRQGTKNGGINSLESILGLPRSLKIRALTSVYSTRLWICEK